jgi:hypothetical protein
MEDKPEGAEEVLRYVREDKGGSQTALFVSKNRERAWFHEIQF